MTDTNQTPDPQAKTPTAPLPPTPEAAPVPGTTAPPYAGHPAHQHGIHVHHPISEGAIVLTVVGFLLFSIFAFGVGWHARSATLGFQAQHGRVMMGQGQGFGQGFGGIPGHPGPGQRGGMKRGGAKLQRGQCFGQRQSQDRGSGLQLPPGHPDIGTP
jgi:hypothetical protein